MPSQEPPNVTRMVALAPQFGITYTPTHVDLYNDIGGAPFLDGNYTVFGEVILGLNIIDSIAVEETGAGDRPLEDIPMTVRVETMDKSDIEQTYGYTYEQ